MSSQSSGRQRINMEEYSAEEEALSIISEAADIRLAAKKAFMDEAKEIRSKEIEKQQKEAESEKGGICNDTTHDAAAPTETATVDLEKKYKVAMVNSAQLNNENQSLVYQVELLRDQVEELDEQHTELQRHYREKCREYDFQKRDLQSLEKDFNIMKQQLEITSKLLSESGLVILVNENGDPKLEKSSQVNLSNNNSVFLGNAFLTSAESRNLSKKTEEKISGTVAESVKKSAESIQVSGSVDEVDGLAFAKVLNHSQNGADRVALNDSCSATASQSVSCVKEVANVESVHGDDGDSIFSDNESLRTKNDMVSECPETENSSLSVENSETVTESSACLRAEPNSVLAEDEVDEFFDAVSTPSPSSKTGSYDEQGVYNQNELTFECSSVDPEIRIKEAPTHTSAESERGSFMLDNVTETESSTDVLDEGEENIRKENITEAECKTTDNQNVDAGFLKEDIESKEAKSVLLETSGESQTEVEDLLGEKSERTENVVEEAMPGNKPEEEIRLETNEALEHIKKDSQEIVCDIPQNVGSIDSASSEESVADEQNKSDITQPVSCESPDSTSGGDDSLECNVSAPCLSQEILQEENGFLESVETISDTLSAENATDVKDTQDLEHEASIGESVVCDNQNISSESGPERLDVSGTVEVLPDDASVKPDSKNTTEKEEGEGDLLSQSTLNLQNENKEGEENLVLGETEDKKAASFEENTSVNVEHSNDNTEENECDYDTDFPAKDSSKLAARTISVGGSEASEGAVIDDYDFDDIDDVLENDSPPHTGADSNTTPSNEAELLVATSTELPGHENLNCAKSPSQIDEEKIKDSKAKGSKKSKSEKSKTGKKSHTEKAAKSKSGEKESKEKAEKTKNKEGKDKSEKVKSSKKESSHEKKAEKSKNKKDVTQDNRPESISGEEDKHSLAESQTSLEADDLEGTLDKQMLESEKSKSPKKSSKKMSIFKKVFK